MNVSVLILTLDEEANLPHCLQSVAWCDDVVVLDSHSRDRTGDIAREAGARVIQRQFDDYASQRNYGLSEVDYRHPWVLMIDADEVVPSDLRDEIERVLANVPRQVCLFRMRRKDYFMGRWIRRSSGYPTWFGRLARVGHVRVERAINEEYHTSGDVRDLNAHIVHYPFNKGFDAWFIKHNRYSTMEAEAKVAGAGGGVRWSELVARDPVVRRKAAKALIYTLPARPVIVFLLLYIVRGGILEGRAGLRFCTLRAIYEYMIDCKVDELRIRASGRRL